MLRASHAGDLLGTAAAAVHFMQADQVDDVAAYVGAQQRADGGFRGRSEAGDVYYTVFGLACLAALARPVSAPALPAWLETFGDGAALDFVHRASAIRCWGALAAVGVPGAAARSQAMLRGLEDCRAADGGYHHQVPHAPQGSVYGGFLAFLAHAENGLDLPRFGELLTSIEGLRTGDGGYANTPDLPVATTTATAAAVLLRHWLDGTVDDAAVAALRACECPQGGFYAMARAPGPDLLATATALHALRAVGAPLIHAGAHLAFIETLWDDNGGFRGHQDDPVTDCEYTFYALLALGACWRDELTHEQ